MSSSDAFYTRGIPPTLKRKYKSLCKKSNIAMTEGLARFLREATKPGSALWQDLLHQPPVGRKFKDATDEGTA